MEEKDTTIQMENQAQEQHTDTQDTATTESAQQDAIGKTYTEEQLAELKSTWQHEYEQSKEAEKDFKTLTPEQQSQKQLDDQKAETARLQAELADRDLADYARSKISEANLPTDAIVFVKGKDQADTDAKIKSFSGLLASGVQAGIEERFKTNGYTPRNSAAGSDGKDNAKAQRGVSVTPAK